MRIIILVIVLLISNHCYSEDLTIGVEKLDYLPFYHIKNKQYQGYARELFDAFAKDYQHKIHYKVLPVARLFHELVNHRIDFKFPDNPNWKKDKKQAYKIQYSQPIIQFIDGVMINAENKDKSPAYFSEIGTMRGFTPWTLLPKIENNSINITEYNSLYSLLQQVKIGRLQGAYINIDVANYFLKHQLNQAEILFFYDKLPHGKSHYYLSTIKREDILQQFNQWLKDNAEFKQQLETKWEL